MSREIAEELADKLVKMRETNRRWYETNSKIYERNPDGSRKPALTVVGGVVRSYQFTYEEGKELAQGSMKIMFSEDAFFECEVTVVIFNDSEANAGITGERIVHNTRKLSDFNESVVEAYFSAYCDKIGKWVVVYEKFESYFDSENQNQFPRLSEEDDVPSLTGFWREKLRSLVQVLAASKKKHVTHGGLLLATGYAISTGTIKLVNVARHVPKSGCTDLGDMAKFLRSNPYLQATSCADWRGFDFLLNSKRMNANDWDTVVLGHPILLEASSGKLNAYEGVEISMWRISERRRTKFASALRIAMPEHYDKNIWYFFGVENEQLVAQLMEKSTPLNNIYLTIIQTARNLSNHARELDNAEKCLLIHKRFRGYMSMAYSVSMLREGEWEEMDSLGFQKKLSIRC